MNIFLILSIVAFLNQDPEPNYFGISNNQFNHRVLLKNKIDSLKTDIVNRTIGNYILSFDIDAEAKNAFGCLITIQNKTVSSRSYKITIADVQEKPSRQLNSSLSVFFNDFFMNTDSYFSDFFPGSKHEISHDDELFLYVKSVGSILFDKYFMRSAFIDTKNSEAKQLIINLGRITSEVEGTFVK